jgi:hypothetical protein
MAYSNTASYKVQPPLHLRAVMVVRQHVKAILATVTFFIFVLMLSSDSVYKNDAEYSHLYVATPSCISAFFLSFPSTHAVCQITFIQTQEVASIVLSTFLCRRDPSRILLNPQFFTIIVDHTIVPIRSRDGFRPAVQSERFIQAHV